MTYMSDSGAVVVVGCRTYFLILHVGTQCELISTEGFGSVPYYINTFAMHYALLIIDTSCVCVCVCKKGKCLGSGHREGQF